MKLTSNQQDVLDHTKKGGFFGTNASGKDFEDCEFLLTFGFMTKVNAPAWSGDDFIYYPTSKRNN